MADTPPRMVIKVRNAAAVKIKTQGVPTPNDPKTGTASTPSTGS